MADYYNATRGPLPLTLHDGTSLSAPPKQWIFIPAEVENSASIVSYLSKGFLVRAKIPMTVAAAVPAEPVVAAVPAEPVVAAPVEPSLPLSEPLKEAAPVVDSTNTFKKAKR